MTWRVMASYPFVKSASGTFSPRCKRRRISWSPISTPWLTLFRA
jgi:hypothetical protein